MEEEVPVLSINSKAQYNALYNANIMSCRVEEHLAAALLKYVGHIPGTAIDELLQDLNYLLCSAPFPLSRVFVSEILELHNLKVDD